MSDEIARVRVARREQRQRDDDTRGPGEASAADREKFQQLMKDGHDGRRKDSHDKKEHRTDAAERREADRPVPQSPQNPGPRPEDAGPRKEPSSQGSAGDTPPPPAGDQTASAEDLHPGPAKTAMDAAPLPGDNQALTQRPRASGDSRETGAEHGVQDVEAKRRRDRAGGLYDEAEDTAPTEGNPGADAPAATAFATVGNAAGPEPSARAAELPDLFNEIVDRIAILRTEPGAATDDGRMSLTLNADMLGGSRLDIEQTDEGFSINLEAPDENIADFVQNHAETFANRLAETLGAKVSVTVTTPGRADPAEPTTRRPHNHDGVSDPQAGQPSSGAADAQAAQPVGGSRSAEPDTTT